MHHQNTRTPAHNHFSLSVRNLFLQYNSALHSRNISSSLAAPLCRRETRILLLPFLGTWGNNWSPSELTHHTCCTSRCGSGRLSLVVSQYYESPKVLLCSLHNLDWCLVGNHRYCIVDCSMVHLVHPPAIEPRFHELFEEAGLVLFSVVLNLIFVAHASDTAEAAQEGSTLVVFAYWWRPMVDQLGLLMKRAVITFYGRIIVLWCFQTGWSTREGKLE